MNLAQRLLKARLLTPVQLGQALYRQKKYRGFLADHILKLKLLDPEVLAQHVKSYPPVPQSFEEVGLPEAFLATLLLKHCFFHNIMTPREMSDALKIPDPLVEKLIQYLQAQKYLDIKPRDVLQATPGHLAVETRYALSDQGKRRAEQELEFNSYVGPAPVPLEDYWDWVEAQTIHRVVIAEERLREVFSDYVVAEDFFQKIGPAVISGRSIFLFGPSGNGKTALAKCIGEAFQDSVYLPYSLYKGGHVIRLFDETNHQLVPPPEGAPRWDGRYLLCRRPLVIAGGELVEDSLELRFNPILKFYEAPHQLRANNGVFIIDDFGRQKMSPRQLLNRWIYPLETRQDFLCLHTGQQFSVPFDQLVIFCTNLDPLTLADAAFLRRIRHKIFLGHVTPEQYLEIFRGVCSQHALEFNQQAVQDMMERHYFQASRPLSACHPRDLIETLVDMARFMGRPPLLTAKDLDYACQSYFVQPTVYTDYDSMASRPEPLGL